MLKHTSHISLHTLLHAYALLHVIKMLLHCYDVCVMICVWYILKVHFLHLKCNDIFITVHFLDAYECISSACYYTLLICVITHISVHTFKYAIKKGSNPRSQSFHIGV